MQSTHKIPKRSNLANFNRCNSSLVSESCLDFESIRYLNIYLGINARVIDVFSVKPLDVQGIKESI